MINAIELLAHMHNHWVKLGLQEALDPDSRYLGTLFEGVCFAQESGYAEYRKLTRYNSKIAHFRQIFTIWKAACARLPRFEFYNDKYDAVVAFPYFFEHSLPELYVAMYRNNVFLGVQFTEDEKARVKAIEEGMLAEEQKKKAQVDREALRRWFLADFLGRRSA